MGRATPRAQAGGPAPLPPAPNDDTPAAKPDPYAFEDADEGKAAAGGGDDGGQVRFCFVLFFDARISDASPPSAAPV